MKFRLHGLPVGMILGIFMLLVMLVIHTCSLIIFRINRKTASTIPISMATVRSIRMVSKKVVTSTAESLRDPFATAIKFRFGLNGNNLFNKQYYIGYWSVNPQKWINFTASVAYKF
jgi:hypothetical protein